jgi:hypothetical protein
MLVGCLVFWGIGYTTGRRVERTNQLGQVLAAQQLERDLWAAVRAVDSIAMRYQIAGLRAASPPRR